MAGTLVTSLQRLVSIIMVISILQKKLIDLAQLSGCNAVKFQKRTIDVVYTPEELAVPRENPFGNTNGELKYGLEFDLED